MVGAVAEIPPLPDPPGVQWKMRVVLTVAILGFAFYKGVFLPHRNAPDLDFLVGLVIGYWFREAYAHRRPP